MGKSPLRLIILRSWHDHQTFTDHLECGHSVWQFAEFDRDNPGINLPVTTSVGGVRSAKHSLLHKSKLSTEKFQPFPQRSPQRVRARIGGKQREQLAHRRNPGEAPGPQ